MKSAYDVAAARAVERFPSLTGAAPTAEGCDLYVWWPMPAALAVVVAIVLTSFAVDPGHAYGQWATLLIRVVAGVSCGVAVVLSWMCDLRA